METDSKADANEDVGGLPPTAAVWPAGDAEGKEMAEISAATA
jgi:hypothetical protein